ncbi:hypothetical protein F8A10_15045 [Paracoccus kondratievae]|uniref:hypothetical protein n=1 Tax=Paracoccus kondratievae TaxID=135740 RepID=UPI0012665D24|nr:hypothetical protein [Paracoccus kondratievae]QFQ88766.1 hypothetical protein F8A10_15045 [Paracoccus kondratievae]
MIGQPSSTGGWVLAAGLSLAVHGAAAGALLWRPTLPWPGATGDPAPAVISVTALPPPKAEPAAEVLTPVTTPAPPPEPQLLTDTGNESAPEPASPETSPVLSNTALPLASDTGSAPEEPATPAGDAETGTVVETDPRLAEVFDRIRTRLTAPCLLALPVADAAGDLQLDLLAADDEQIPAMMRELTEGLETRVSVQAVLLDQRQCPALTFARRDQRYPVLPLAIQLDTPDIASGENLRGTVAGAGGRPVTLLLIDDNGVTHDIRRFLVIAGGQMRFDLPIAREGAARDTRQVLLAIATPNRLTSVGALAGELAEDFFARLSLEVGPEALIGVSSIHVRPRPW